MSTNAFKRLARFHPKSDSSSILIGQPVDEEADVGAAVRNGDDVAVKVFTGSSVLSPGSPSDRVESIKTLLSPLSQNEVGTIRCIGLNSVTNVLRALKYRQHAEEAKMAIPKEPTLFMKPQTSLADPWPAPTVIPKHTLQEDCCDYESELAIIIGKDARYVSEVDALDYVLGYAAANDVSSRAAQFASSQWSFSKGFDGACPLGPVIVSTSAVPDPKKLHVRGLKNGRVMQDCGVNDLIFNVPQIVSYLSQGTTLKAGTVILTGTPAGVGFGFDPKEYLRDGDEFSVEILPYIGTLTTKFVAEK